jgi:hypothetical protein
MYNLLYDFRFIICMQHIVIIFSPFCLPNHSFMYSIILYLAIYIFVCSVRFVCLFSMFKSLSFLLDFFILCMIHPFLGGLFPCVYSRGKAVARECINA